MTTLGETPALNTRINIFVLHVTKPESEDHSTCPISTLFENASLYNVSQVTKVKRRGNLLTENEET